MKERNLPEPAEQLRIRDAAPGDAAVIAEIYNEAIDRGIATMDSERKSAAVVRGWIEGFGPRETILLLERIDAEGRAEIVGWGIIKKYSDRHGYRTTCETSVYLRHREAGRGYGTRVKLALIERCRSYGYHHLVAKIFAVNEGSIRYNLKLGYEMVGIQKEVGYRDGRWLDVAILQLVLHDVDPSDAP